MAVTQPHAGNSPTAAAQPPTAAAPAARACWPVSGPLLLVCCFARHPNGCAGLPTLHAGQMCWTHAPAVAGPAFAGRSAALLEGSVGRGAAGYGSQQVACEPKQCALCAFRQLLHAVGEVQPDKMTARLTA